MDAHDLTLPVNALIDSLPVMLDEVRNRPSTFLLYESKDATYGKESFNGMPFQIHLDICFMHLGAT